MRRMELKTVVVSRKGKYPGFDLADQVYYYDTQDKENILKAACIEEICAITTDQTDVSVATVAYVADKLKLRGIGQEIAKKFTNKYEMRKAARDAGYFPLRLTTTVLRPNSLHIFINGIC